jgi:hypothetical protein
MKPCSLPTCRAGRHSFHPFLLNFQIPHVILLLSVFSQEALFFSQCSRASFEKLTYLCRAIGSSETRCTVRHRVFGVYGSSGPDPSTTIPSTTFIAQFIAVSSASTLAVELHISSPFSSQWREKRKAALRRTPPPTDRLQPTTNSDRSICDSRWVSRPAHRCSRTGLESFPSPGSSAMRPLSWVPFGGL